MQLILNNQFRRSVIITDTKERAYILFPRNHGKFINRAEQQCRWVLVEFLVNDLNRKLVSKAAALLRTEQSKVSVVVHTITERPDKFLP